MNQLICPICEMSEVLQHPNHMECITCGHEWVMEVEGENPAIQRIVKDAHGNILENGDIVAMIKDLKLKGSSEILKIGTKSKPIRIVDGDHEIDCKMGGISIALKAMYVKKVVAGRSA